MLTQRATETVPPTQRLRTEEDFAANIGKEATQLSAKTRARL